VQPLAGAVIVIWDRIHGHADVIEKFRRSFARGRLSGTYLFVGPSGIGKRTFAKLLAQCLLCERFAAAENEKTELDACGTCPACQQVEAQTHPDFDVICKPKERAFIPLELFIGQREHRMREGFCHWISLRPSRGKHKVAIIDDADYLNEEGANSLLKTLEEPPAHSVIILIGSSAQQQLPTIRSRSQIVQFQKLTSEVISALLTKTDTTSQVDHALLSHLAGGSLDAAAVLADPYVSEFRASWLMALASGDPARDMFVKQVTAFVDAAGSEGALKRQRMKMLADWGIELFRNIMRSQLEPQQQLEDEQMLSAVQRALEMGLIGAERSAACAERCLETHAHIFSNANQAPLLECLLEELGQISRGELIPEVID
jgi:DNA polymerase III subunit delta'